MIMEIIAIESKAFQEIIDEIKSIKAEIEKTRSENIKDTILSSEQVQSILGISQKTWQTYRDRRMIPFSQIGNKIYIKSKDLETFLSNHRIEKSQRPR